MVPTYLDKRDKALNPGRFRGTGAHTRGRAGHACAPCSAATQRAGGWIHCASHKASPRSSVAASSFLRRSATAASKALQIDNAATCESNGDALEVRANSTWCAWAAAGAAAESVTSTTLPPRS